MVFVDLFKPKRKGKSVQKFFNFIAACLLLFCSVSIRAAVEPSIKEELIHTLPENRVISKSYLFLAANGRYAYIAYSGKLVSAIRLLCIDGKEQIIPEKKRVSSLGMFSQNGKMFYYTLEPSGLRSGNQTIILDGKEFNSSPSLPVEYPRFPLYLSPDGNHYSFFTNEKKNKAVYVDDKKVYDFEGKSFESFRPFFHSDSPDIDFSYKSDPANFFDVSSTNYVVIGYKATKGYSLQVTGDGKHHAYIDESIKKMKTVILNDKPMGTFPSVSLSQFDLSPDGDRVAFAIKDGYAWSVFENQKKIASFKKGVGRPVYSYDGKHLAFVGSNEKNILDFFLDGNKVKTYEIKKSDLDFYPAPELSWSGNRFAYYFKENRMIIGCVDETVADIELSFKAELTVSNVLFSPSEKHFCFIEGNDEEMDIVFDGITSRTYTSIRDVSLSDTQLEFMAVDKNKIFHVTWKFNEDKNQ